MIIKTKRPPGTDYVSKSWNVYKVEILNPDILSPTAPTSYLRVFR